MIRKVEFEILGSPGRSLMVIGRPNSVELTMIVNASVHGPGETAGSRLGIDLDIGDFQDLLTALNECARAAEWGTPGAS